MSPVNIKVTHTKEMMSTVLVEWKGWALLLVVFGLKITIPDENSPCRVGDWGGGNSYHNGIHHVTPARQELHWLSIRFWIECKINILTFKCRKGIAPSYRCELIE